MTCKVSRTLPPFNIYFHLLFVRLRSFVAPIGWATTQHREALLTSAATRVMSTLDSANGKQHWIAAKNQARNTGRYHMIAVVIVFSRHSKTHTPSKGYMHYISTHLVYQTE